MVLDLEPQVPGAALGSGPHAESDGTSLGEAQGVVQQSFQGLGQAGRVAIQGSGQGIQGYLRLQTLDPGLAFELLPELCEMGAQVRGAGSQREGPLGETGEVE